MPHIPRFPALALFGRRLSEREDGLGMPASENLHKGGSEVSFDHLIGPGEQHWWDGEIESYGNIEFGLRLVKR